MNLLIIMEKVALAVGGIACGFFGIVLMLATFFLRGEKLEKMGVRGTKTRHRIVVFILGYLLLSLGVFLIWLLF